jgi:acyl-CoA synthetase (AMP-forming)/AMP-acid ligase II/pyrroloquinoline quinone (PQQ) biosynthesis protein C
MTAQDLFLRLSEVMRQDREAVRGPGGALTFRQLVATADQLAQALTARSLRVIASRLDNGPGWVVVDLAALRAGVVHVPLPSFFTGEQTAHALRAVGAEAVIAAAGAGERAVLEVAGEALALRYCAHARVELPAQTAKVTFTSGTTGRPKGVCLSAESMLAVAEGLARALHPLSIDCHLCALPLPVLLENIAGIYAPLLAGATCVVLPGERIGLQGSSKFEPAALQAEVERHGAESVILLPQMLRLWAGWRQHAGAGPLGQESRLKFVAVGGASVGAALLQQARAVGLPAYEGYGLSEGASVQTLNLPGADCPGSAGRPLPHARLRVGSDGGIEFAGPRMLGYVGEPQVEDTEWLATGDLGSIDADGFVHLRGRRSSVLITGYGRNVSPEWIETALQSHPSVAHAVVLGDGEASLWAVLWPGPGVGAEADRAIAAAVSATNGSLPDYARLGAWVLADRPFCVDSGLATANGRPQRAAVLAYGQSLPRRLVSASRFDQQLTPAVLDMANSPMSFFGRLQHETAAGRMSLLGAPIIQGALRGEVSVPSYLAFLREAYHHVRHTVPLLEACRARLPERLAWMRPALDEYIEEESGHDEWILDDIAAAGGDADAVRSGAPGAATEIMVAYAYDTIARGNPLGFLGMVHVLEGTSVALALTAAERIQHGLGLPDAAFTYLRSHGTLDREHTAQFELLVNAIEDDSDRAAVVHAACLFYRLYGDVFRDLPRPDLSLVARQALPEAA